MTFAKNNFVIAHGYPEPISEAEIYETLPAGRDGRPTYIHHINAETLKLDRLPEKDLNSILAMQEVHFTKHTRQALNEHRECQLFYFGAVPAAMALQLGHRIGSGRKVQVFLQDHASKTWEWTQRNVSYPLTKGIPSETFRAAGDVVVRFGTSVKIDREETQTLIPNAIRELEIYPELMGHDIFGSLEQLAGYAQWFRVALDAVKSHLPRTQAIHLFPEVPAGLALLMGHEIQEDHPEVMIYGKALEGNAGYRLLRTINRPWPNNPWPLTDYAHRLTAHWLHDLRDQVNELLGPYLRRLAEEPNRNWFKALFPTFPLADFQVGQWPFLPRLDHAVGGIEEHTDRLIQGLPTPLVKPLLNRLPRPDDQRMAARLLFFHSAISPPAESASTRYFRLSETAHHQADVYALLHEFHCLRPPREEAAAYFLRMIQVWCEVVWAEADHRQPSTRQPVEQVQRMLFWLFLACRIESQEQWQPDEIKTLLAHRPQLNLRLLPTPDATGQRIEYHLNPTSTETLSLSVIHRGSIHSERHDPGHFDLVGLLEGLRTRDAEKIKPPLHAFIARLPD